MFPLWNVREGLSLLFKLHQTRSSPDFTLLMDGFFLWQQMAQHTNTQVCMANLLSISSWSGNLSQRQCFLLLIATICYLHGTVQLVFCSSCIMIQRFESFFSHLKHILCCCHIVSIGSNFYLASRPSESAETLSLLPSSLLKFLKNMCELCYKTGFLHPIFCHAIATFAYFLDISPFIVLQWIWSDLP